ncbi:MAG: DUF1592 domain-containing protein [Gemmataceae bacterium]
MRFPPFLVLLVLAASPMAVQAQDRERDFAAKVAPVLKQYCLGCHSSEKPRGNMVLDVYKDAAAAEKNPQVWAKVMHQLRSGEMPPKGKPRPGIDAIEGLSHWVDSHVFKVDCQQAREPGKVTIRRLNRAEYNNTIRDLVGVNFRPADDFPADDVGYGFDNIGDVLSLPPLLMEKYLAAAEKIAEQAILAPEQFPGTKTTLRGSSLHGGQRNGENRALYSRGEVTAEHDFAETATYALRVRAWAQQAGNEPAKLLLKLDGKDLQAVEVKAVEGDAKAYEIRVKVEKGKHKLAADFINDFYDKASKADRNVYINAFEVQGPLGQVPDKLPASQRQILFCTPGKDGTKEECARKILERFVSRAYRRPVRGRDIDRLLELVKLAESNGDSFERGIQLAVQATLVSPYFLFKVETGNSREQGNIRNLTEHELATRLSYFLWSTMPDEELFEQARAGTLRKNLETQVRRMLKDPKSRALVDNFASQWLQTRNLEKAQPDTARFPAFNEALRNAMLKETELFFTAVIREDRSILDFIDADYTYLNEPLAKLYGVQGVKGNDFRKVSLAGTARSGILTQASILTATSNPTRTSPVKRGKWILENILGTPPPPPPPEVEELNESQEAELKGSLRQRMELHRSKPICASCHERMDPLGFGFENFDAIGAWRAKDGKFAVDASGVLPDGSKFSGPKELKAVLKKRKDEFARCLAEKMLTYALGRGVEYFDKCVLDDVARALPKNEYRFSTLVLEIVKSDAFQKRRVKVE